MELDRHPSINTLSMVVSTSKNRQARGSSAIITVDPLLLNIFGLPEHQATHLIMYIENLMEYVHFLFLCYVMVSLIV